MTDVELRKRIRSRKWEYNNFTCYLIESGMTAYRISAIFDMSRASVCYWLHASVLSAPVNAFFLTMRKIYMMYGVTLNDIF